MRTYIEWNLTLITPVPANTRVAMCWEGAGERVRFGVSAGGRFVVEGNEYPVSTQPKWWADVSATCPEVPPYGKVDADQELDAWKHIAAYLGECQAATAEDLLARKSTSKSERKRQQSICKVVADSLRNGRLTGARWYSRPTDLALESAIERAARIAKE